MFDSPWHWAVVAVVAFILFFGWKQLPDMSRSLGRSLRIFKTEIKGMGDDDKARSSRESDGSGETRAIEPAQAEQPAPKALPEGTPDRETAAVRPSPRPSPRPNGSAPTGSQSRAASGQ